ncbi:MAG: DUF1223 domain-containing protein [Parafilimonas sp.]
MKIIPALAIIIFMSSSFSCTDSSAKNSARSKADNGFAVVELFTSEGCSSCPPADAAVARLLKKYSNNVYVLGYHVDYWDNLGWKDMFSSAAYTQRQREYGKFFKLSSIYTPQIVVNGTEQFIGSDENKLNDAVTKDLQQTSTAKLTIDATATDNKTVIVNYTTDVTNAKVKIALIQLVAENKIKRGENSGATLHHVNIVRDLKIVSASATGNVVLNIPDGLSEKGFRIIAFTQNINDSKITAAMEVNIQ